MLNAEHIKRRLSNNYNNVKSWFFTFNIWTLGDLQHHFHLFSSSCQSKRLPHEGSRFYVLSHFVSFNLFFLSIFLFWCLLTTSLFLLFLIISIFLRTFSFFFVMPSTISLSFLSLSPSLSIFVSHLIFLYSLLSVVLWVQSFCEPFLVSRPFLLLLLFHYFLSMFASHLPLFPSFYSLFLFFLSFCVPFLVSCLFLMLFLFHSFLSISLSLSMFVFFFILSFHSF